MITQFASFSSGFSNSFPSSWILIKIVSARSVYSSSRSCMFWLLIKPGVRNLSKLSRSIKGIFVELQPLLDAVTPNFGERWDIEYDHIRTQSPKPHMAKNLMWLNCHFDAKKSLSDSHLSLKIIYLIQCWHCNALSSHRVCLFFFLYSIYFMTIYTKYIGCKMILRIMAQLAQLSFPP